MEVVSHSSWDEDFFKSYTDFRNAIHKGIPNSLNESIDSYKRFFGPNSVFRKDFKWIAVQVRKEGIILAQGILSWRRDSRAGNLGFLDFENNQEGASRLLQEIESFARDEFIQKIKTPIDINFFVKYRMRIKGSSDTFFGEPVYPEYYHSLLEKCDYQVIGRWESFKLNKFQSIKDYFIKRKSLETRTVDNQYKKLRIRTVRMDKWEEELRLIHSLLLESYSKMPEWENIALEQFKVIYDDFKYIIHPWMSYIVEWQGKPVGFSINFADPLKIMKRVEGKNLSSFDKLIIFIRLRLNFSTLLISHVGKIPGPNGEEMKGVQILASRKIQFWALLMNRVLVTFQTEGSPSRRAFEKGSQSLFSEYVLYGKNL